MTNHDLLALGRLLDAMDDEYDGRISGEQLVEKAASTLASLDPAAALDSDLARAVRALKAFIDAAREAPSPLDLYGELRLALADLPPPPGWRAFGPWRTFSLRVLQASWGIAIDLQARSGHCGEFPPGSLQVADRVALAVGDVELGEQDTDQLVRGLALMAPAIQRRRPNAQVLVELGAVTFTLTDYQPEGLAAAMIGWAAEEFRVEQVAWELRYDGNINRYVLSH